MINRPELLKPVRNNTTELKVQKIYSLSPMQEGMLFHSLVEKESNTYFQQLSFCVEGEFVPELFEKSFNIIIDRHDILRTNFVHEKVNRPQQVVFKERPIKVHFEDLTEMCEADKKNFMKDFMIKDKEQGFNLLKGILIRLFIFKLDEQSYKVIISNHHIILDGWSIGVVTKEVLKAYKMLLKCQNPVFAEARPYSTYINWLKQLDEEKSSTYWKEYLKGYEQQVGIPRLYKTGGDGKYEQEEHHFVFNRELTKKLEELAKGSRVTLNTIIQVIWGIVLQKYNNAEDVVFGSIVSGRPPEIPDVENIVGLFINVIPVRVKCNKEQSFAALVKQVQEDAFKSKNHEYYPMAEIQSSVELKQGLLDNILGFENYPIEKAVFSSEEEFSISDAELFMQSNYDFNISVIPGEELGFRFRFNALTYSSELVTNIEGHLINIATQVIENPQIKIEELEIITSKEKSQILFDFNNTRTDFPYEHTLQELFERQVKEAPSNTAIVFEGQSLTYGELNNSANRFARVLREKGVGRNSVVALILNRSPEMIISILAVLKAGGAYLPINPEFPSERIVGILNDSEASLVVTQRDVVKELSFTAMLNIDELGTEQVKKIVTGTRAQITDLDKHPYPDRSLVNYDRYINYIGMAHVKNSFAIQGTRGCPYNCAYCHKIWPKTHSKRSAEHIFEEVKYLYDAGARRFTFVDDIFNLDVKNSSRFFKMILDNKMKVNFFFPNGVRGDILTKDYIDLMIEAGAKGLSLALETATPRLQKLIGKNLMLDKLRENLEYISAKHPEVILDLFWMIGFPTETEQEALDTLNFVKSIQWLHFPVLSILKIYPNTDMEKLAFANGVSGDAIKKSCNIAYHELPDTLPFSKGFARQIQASFLNEYFLSKERLNSVIDIQRSFFTEDELLQKYNSYMPEKVNSLKDIMRIAGVENYVPREVKKPEPCPPIYLDKLAREPLKPKVAVMNGQNPIKILLLDLSQYFTGDNTMLYDVAEPPLGQMYVMTYLNKYLGSKIDGKVLKSRFDFNSYDELKQIIEEFKPDVIGTRSLTFYKDFFHKTIACIRQWGIDVPIIAGGPYATSDYLTILNDKNVDLVIRGEGEVTMYELMVEFLKNNKKMPEDKVLACIDGIAFVENKERSFLEAPVKTYREIIMLDAIKYEMAKKSSENPEPVNKSDDLAYVMYTSGSTGKPKGNLISHFNISRVVKNTNYIEINDKDTLLQLSNYAFDGSTFDIYGALLNGARLVMLNHDILLDVAKLSELIKNEGITMFFVTTALFNALVDVSPESFKSIRKVLFGGEKVSVKHVEKALAYMGPGRISHVYGPTESTVFATYFPVDSINKKLGTIPIGKPLANTEVYVVDSHLRLQPVGVPGEICISGKGLAKGYFKRPELTEEKFIQNPFKQDELIYRTGDLGKWLPDGSIEFLDRADTQVKLRGFRIELGEIEAQLMTHADVKEAVVLCQDDKEGNKFLYAYLVGVTELSVMELRDFLSMELPDYMIPSYFVQLDRIPLTPSGKVDKKVLLNYEVMNAGMEYAAPETDTEKILSEVWQEVLGVRRIGINDNYFSQGGDSIKAIQIASRLQKLQLKMEIKDLFQHPTVRELSHYIKQTDKKAVQITVTGEVLLTPIQRWFFESRFTDMHHFNHSVMLHSPVGLDEGAIESVFSKITIHHDALRMVFRVENGRRVQYNRGIEGSLLELETVDLSKETNCVGRIEEEANRVQSGMNLEEGPLVKLRLFKTVNGDHLLIVIHHLVVDGISWRIILEDFAVGYTQAIKGQPIKFQDKTSSFKDWAYKLSDFAAGGKIEEEAVFWKKVMEEEILNLPKDACTPLNKVKDGAEIVMELSEEYTEKLLKDVNAAYNTEINDILIAALGLALKEWCGHDKLLINLEGHGREDIIDGVDINRTVGWFSSVYPVVLDMTKSSDLSYCIKNIKDRLNRIPQKGIGYGILEYLSPDAIKSVLDFKKKAEISFNYLGQFDQDIKTEVFGLSSYSTGISVSPELERRYVLDINGLMKNNKLYMTFDYNRYEYREETISELVKSYKNSIIYIINHCIRKEHTEMTPTDLLYNELSIEEFEDITGELADILD